MRIPRLSIIATAMCVGASALPAQNMLVREPSHYANYGYGHSTWGTFTGIFNAAFGAANINVTAAVTPGSLAGYSALMLTLPNLPDAPYLLTAAEMAEITTFLNAGGRVYAFGENSAWDNWNNNIAALVGATVGGSYTGTALPVGPSGLLTGVNSVYYPAGGAFLSLGGGQPLFNTNVAALFGPSLNALFILDVNLCDNNYIGNADNLRFCQNIGGWLAGHIDPPQSGVPEPATFVLLGSGLAVIAATRFRRKA